MLSELRRYIYHTRHSGFAGLFRYIRLSNFEKKIFKDKTLKWNNLGYWEMYTMPTTSELKKFYSEIYWLNNKYYKSHLLIGRDLSHLNFLEQKIPEKLIPGSIFMNYGAGHGGVSYLAAAKNLRVINIEPSELYTGGLNNFINYFNLEDYFTSSENSPKVDVFYSSHTLEHLNDPILFFKNILRLINDNGKVVIEVPNCRVINPGKDYNEGGCNGKLSSNHTLFFTKDFFEKLNAKIFLYTGDVDQGEYLEVPVEDNAKCIRAIIDPKNISKWINEI
jgi:2-polyprenyl-3-methyl-5-hydroxy-6-metoxy-1,4-benzoquinol methylase|tara:strand:+ start:52 stop:882 length:831 start_codon:yes stop_codon:yes gene_type:complete